MKTDTKISNNFIQLIKDTKPSIWMISIAVFLSVINTLVGLVIPLVTKTLVDTLSFTNIDYRIILLLIVAFVGQAVAGGVSVYLLSVIGQHIVAQLRVRLWDKLIVLPVAFYDKFRSNEMVSRMINDTAVLKGLITDHLISFFTGMISMVGAIIILLFIDWQMTLVLFIAVPLMVFILIPLGRKMRTISRELQHHTAQFTAYISQILGDIRLVKVSNAEKNERVNAREEIDVLFQFGKKEGKVQALVAPLVSFVMMSLLVVIIGYGGMRVATGDITPGGLVAFILYMFQIMLPLAQFSRFFTELQKAKGATERIMMNLEEPVELLTDGKEQFHINQPITIKNVSFAYETTEEILQNISFTAHPGTVTAIVGPSGSGKTTLFSLLERFYDPTEGDIYLGENSLRTLSLSTWRKQIGYVSQENPIIAGTILENITFGLEAVPSKEKIEKALQMAYAKEFVYELPDGIETEVGERGIKLSGGQRQRIGIARALLRDPQILMLDEATSSLDSKSEIEVQKALDNLMKGRTTFVIAHRLSTIMDAHHIIFLDKGVITGNGTHEELMKSHVLYKEFTKQQLKLDM